ncbi:MAG: hypothetical protein JXB39_07015 [Deltaproteobacteria bacterium]|nr:hypothetical protein [Deltaproteobacteria bacterium]
MGPVVLLLAGLLLGVPSVEAASTETAAAPALLQAPTASGLVIRADVQREQLMGRPILVSVTARNPTQASQTFPDLATRPHLVRFDISVGGGRPQSRYTTPPAQDADVRWTLNPGGERRALLEIPTSSGFKAERFDLAIRVLNGEETVSLGPVPISLTWPDPSAGHLVPDLEATESIGWMSVWSHRTPTGADLYLDVRASLDSNRRGDQWFLAHVDAPVVPQLAASRPTEAKDRHVYWHPGGRSLWYLRTQSTGARTAPRRADLPWPDWEFLARGISDPKGGLHVPVWIPAPSGRGGEVRVVSIDPQGTPYFRVVVKLPERPRAWSTADLGGQVRLLLLQGGNLDLYTLSTDPRVTLPASGVRLLPPHVRKPPKAKKDEESSKEGEEGEEAAETTEAAETPPEVAAEAAPEPPPVPTIPPLPPTTGATFAMLPDTPEQPGGLAVFAWAETGTTERLLSGAWLSLRGREIARIEGMVLPKGHQVHTVIPAGYEPLIAVSIDASGKGSLLRANLDAPLALGAISPDEVIRPDGKGNLVRVSMRAREGVTSSRIAVPR